MSRLNYLNLADEMLQKGYFDEAYLDKIRKLPLNESMDVIYGINSMPIDLIILRKKFKAINLFEERKISRLPLIQSVKWIKILKDAHFQNIKGWINNKEFKALRKKIGGPTNEIEQHLTINSKVNRLIDSMLERGELSQEDANGYRKMSPSKAWDELRTKIASVETEKAASEILDQKDPYRHDAFEKEMTYDAKGSLWMRRDIAVQTEREARRAEVFKRSMDQLLKHGVIDEADVQAIEEMKPGESHELVEQLISMPRTIRNLKELDAITTKEVQTLKTLPAEMRLKWVNLLRESHFQYDKGWITKGKWKEIRQSLGGPMDKIEQELMISRRVNQFMRSLLEDGELPTNDYTNH